MPVYQDAIMELYKEARIVRQAIRVYGGSFMQAIGDAMDCADIHNLAKIRDTWKEEWSRYLEMARLKTDDEPEPTGHA